MQPSARRGDTLQGPRTGLVAVLHTRWFGGGGEAARAAPPISRTNLPSVALARWPCRTCASRSHDVSAVSVSAVRRALRYAVCKLFFNSCMERGPEDRAPRSMLFRIAWISVSVLLFANLSFYSVSFSVSWSRSRCARSFRIHYTGVSGLRSARAGHSKPLQPAPRARCAFETGGREGSARSCPPPAAATAARSGGVWPFVQACSAGSVCA